MLRKIAPWILLALLAGIMAMTSGCATPMAIGARVERLGQPQEDALHGALYPATAFDGGMLFYGYWHRTGGWVDPSELKMFLPLTVIDLPLAIATDTLSLPFDLHYFAYARRADAYWDNAFKTGDMVAKDAPCYLTRHARDRIRWAITSDTVPSNVVDVVLDLATTNTHMAETVLAISQRHVLSTHECKTLYDWQDARPLRDNYGCQVRNNLAKHPATPDDLVMKLFSSPDENTRITTIGTGRIPLPLVTNELVRLASSQSWGARRFVAAHPATTPDTLAQLATTDQWSVQEAVAANTNSLIVTLKALSASRHKQARAAVAANPLTPLDVIVSMSDDQEGCVRAAIAANAITPVAILTGYSSDKHYDVLRNLARNPNTPHEVLVSLTTNYYVYIQGEARLALKKREQNKPSDRTR